MKLINSPVPVSFLESRVLLLKNQEFVSHTFLKVYFMDFFYVSESKSRAATAGVSCYGNIIFYIFQLRTIKYMHFH